MAREGQEIEGPNGQRLRFVRIADEVLEMETEYPGGAELPPPHMHPRQGEEFTVLEGTVRAVTDGHERQYSTGESFEVPAATVHQMTGAGHARVKWVIRPALRSAEFFEELFTGAAAEDPAGFLARYAEEFQLAQG